MSESVFPKFNRPRTSQKLPYLTLALFGSIALLLLSVQRDYALVGRIQRIKEAYLRSQRLAAIRRRDPAVGAVMPLRSIAEKQKPESYALLFIGPCAPCVASNLQTWRDLLGRNKNRTLIIISHDTRQNIDQFIRQEKFPLPIVEDPNGELSRKYNAVWVPRAYRLDAEKRLVWLQTDDRMHPVNVAAELWPQGDSLK